MRMRTNVLDCEWLIGKSFSLNAIKSWSTARLGFVSDGSGYDQQAFATIIGSLTFLMLYRSRALYHALRCNDAWTRIPWLFSQWDTVLSSSFLLRFLRRTNNALAIVVQVYVSIMTCTSNRNEIINELTNTRNHQCTASDFQTHAIEFEIESNPIRQSNKCEQIAESKRGERIIRWLARANERPINCNGPLIEIELFRVLTLMISTNVCCCW